MGVVVESIFCGALGVPEILLRYVNGGGVLIYSIFKRIKAGARYF